MARVDERGTMHDAPLDGRRGGRVPTNRITRTNIEDPAHTVSADSVTWVISGQVSNRCIPTSVIRFAVTIVIVATASELETSSRRGQAFEPIISVRTDYTSPKAVEES